MSIVVADPDRVQMQYRGFFAEPVFDVLGNPARLYTNLLRYLGRFGATAGGLNINVGVLAQANVSCVLSSGFVRVVLDHLEVFVRDVRSEKLIEQVLNQALATMLETGDSLRPVRHEMTLLTWARLKEEPFSTYIRRFVTAPAGLARPKPSVEFIEMSDDGTPLGAIRLEEAVDIREGLFLRSTMNLGSRAPRSDELVSAFMERLRAQLKVMDLELTLGVD